MVHAVLGLQPLAVDLEQPFARGKARYDRFLKSVGAGMVGDSEMAMKELVNRGEEH